MRTTVHFLTIGGPSLPSLADDRGNTGRETDARGGGVPKADRSRWVRPRFCNRSAGHGQPRIDRARAGNLTGRATTEGHSTPHGGDATTSAFTEVYNIGGYGDSEEEQKEAMQDYIRQARARRAAGSPMPPVTLKVAFENRGTEPIEVEVTEVNSDLGNFAVRPAKLTIAPGTSGVLDPMVSQLGVTSDEIPLKLALRTGGKKEQQVVMVKNVFAASVRKELESLAK